MALEPTGTGLQLPSVVVEGKENNRNQLYKRQRPDWKSVRIVDDETKEKFDIADWAYDEKSYPQFYEDYNRLGGNAHVIVLE